MAIDRTWYNALVDDSGGGLDGTVWSKAQVNSLLNLLDNRPRARAYNNTTQSLSNATLTLITFNSEDFDQGALHSTVSNTGRMTIPTGFAGYYIVIGKVAYAANATGVRVARLRVNGADVVAQSSHAATAAATQVVQVSALLSLADADYVELHGYQDSTGALNTGDASSRVIQNELQIVQVI